MDLKLNKTKVNKVVYVGSKVNKTGSWYIKGPSRCLGEELKGAFGKLAGRCQPFLRKYGTVILEIIKHPQKAARGLPL